MQIALVDFECNFDANEVQVSGLPQTSNGRWYIISKRINEFIQTRQIFQQKIFFSQVLNGLKPKFEKHFVEEKERKIDLLGQAASHSGHIPFGEFEPNSRAIRRKLKSWLKCIQVCFSMLVYTHSRTKISFCYECGVNVRLRFVNVSEKCSTSVKMNKDLLNAHRKRNGLLFHCVDSCGGAIVHACARCRSVSFIRRWLSPQLKIIFSRFHKLIDQLNPFKWISMNIEHIYIHSEYFLKYLL